ncbi:hypothetical protein A6E13_18030 [Aliivibrio fischeri]|nr:hypothetical protein A6E13_18030 [Aliivibrio fischeri]
MQIVELSESYDQYQNKSRLAENKLNELEANVNKKQEEPDEVKKGVEFYKAKKFKLDVFTMLKIKRCCTCHTQQKKRKVALSIVYQRCHCGEQRLT